MSEVITAALSLVGTLVGTLGGIALSSNLTNYRIEQLEKKVEKHNNLISRTYELERSIPCWMSAFAWQTTVLRTLPRKRRKCSMKS